MNMNCRILAAAGGTVLLLLIGWWLMLDRTPPAPSSPLPIRCPVAVRSPEQNDAPAIPAPAPLPVTVAVATNRPAVNAADLYGKAIGMIVALSDNEKEVLRDWKAAVDPAVAAELCGKLQPIVALAHEAAATTNCDWGVKNVGFETKLTYLNPARSLARAVVWHAAHCREGDAAGISDDLEATLRIGQDSSQFLIGHLVNTAIEAMAIECLAAHASALDADALTRLSELFGSDQYEESLYRALDWEAVGVELMADRFATMTPEQIQEMFQQLGGDDPVGLMDKAQVVAATWQVAELEREYVKMMDAPDAEYQAWLTKLRAVQETNPFVKLLWPAMDTVLDKTRATVVQRAMMVAGLKVYEYGPNALLQYRDPSTGQAFVYRETAAGFELESAYQQKGKPVVLSFPKP